MRTLFNAAFLASSLVFGAGLASPVLAADLDHYYEPRPVPMLPPPPPRCGVYRPCYNPYPRLGYLVPRHRYGYMVPNYGHPVYPRYGYDRYGYDHSREPLDRYGYAPPRIQPYQAPRERLDHYGDDERRRDNERYGYGPDGLGPDYRREPDPYGRG